MYKRNRLHIRPNPSLGNDEKDANESAISNKINEQSSSVDEENVESKLPRRSARLAEKAKL